MSSSQIKAAVASYWRYVRQSPVVAMEASSNLSAYSDDERADILVVNKQRLLIETEVKVDLGDLRRDFKKRKHLAFKNGGAGYPTSYFYFAVPMAIAKETVFICDQHYTYAGVLGCGGNELGVRVCREAKALAGRKLTFPQVLRIVKGQSGTVCRLANKVSELTRVLDHREKELKEYRDWKRLMALAEIERLEKGA